MLSMRRSVGRAARRWCSRRYRSKLSATFRSWTASRRIGLERSGRLSRGAGLRGSLASRVRGRTVGRGSAMVVMRLVSLPGLRRAPTRRTILEVFRPPTATESPSFPTARRSDGESHPNDGRKGGRVAQNPLPHEMEGDRIRRPLELVSSRPDMPPPWRRIYRSRDLFAQMFGR